MQIGVYIGNYQPESGGAYTFAEDVLEAFLEVAAISNHGFVIFCNKEAISAIQAKIFSQNISVKPFSNPNIFGRLFIKLEFFSPIFRWFWRRFGRFAYTTNLHKLDLLWFMGVETYVCPEVPYITTLWDMQHRYQPFFPEVSAKGIWDTREQFFSYFLRRSAYCLTGTETGKREIQYFYQLAESRIRVFPLPTPKYALHAPESTIDVKTHFGISKDYIFYPAQFWPHKNHINLILALKTLKSEYGIDLALVLTGSDKGNRTFVEHFVEQQGVTDSIYFLGFVSKDELIALYRQAKALTFITYFGPDNIPPLEAFALGCPVVASSVDGAKEQYNDAAILVDPSSPKDIASAISQLYLDENLCKTLVDAGYKKSEEWTSVDYVKAVLNLFDEFSNVRRNWP